MSDKIDLAKEALRHKEEAQRAPSKGPELVDRERTFSLSGYREPGTGEELSGVFTAVSPETDYPTDIARYAAGRAGVPWSFLDPAFAERFTKIATVVICTKDASPWILKWIHQDGALLDMVYQVVDGHLARFLGRDRGAGEEASRRPIVAIHPVGAPGAEAKA